jgi:23S rRNA (adenine2503-C2)-methyltransferase
MSVLNICVSGAYRARRGGTLSLATRVCFGFTAKRLENLARAPAVGGRVADAAPLYLLDSRLTSRTNHRSRPSLTSHRCLKLRQASSDKPAFDLPSARESLSARPMKPRPALLSLTQNELQDWFAAKGESRYRSEQVLGWIYQKRVERFNQMSNLPGVLHADLESAFALRSLQCIRQTGSKDTTRKFLFSLPDQNLVESVLIPASPALYGSTSDRRTLCISTQVGCAYGCKFCASGLNGWTRDLLAGEIVEQIIQVEAISGEKINNLVFMGMGEPLANFKNVMRAIEIINAPWGLGIGARHITISTSGLAPRIRQLAEQPLQVRLAISLHGATDEVRNQIMPINRKYNLASLVEACVYFTEKKKQRLTFEYILIESVNDQIEQAIALAALAVRLKAKVNLIPYNRVEGLPWKRPGLNRQHVFLRTLERSGVDATIRREKGHDIDAACGQLRLQTMRDKSFAGVSEVG